MSRDPNNTGIDSEERRTSHLQTPTVDGVRLPDSLRKALAQAAEGGVEEGSSEFLAVEEALHALEDITSLGAVTTRRVDRDEVWPTSPADEVDDARRPLSTVARRLDAGPDRPQAGTPGSDCLVVLHGRDRGRRYDLQGGQLRVGRAADAEICLCDESVSRRHAVVRRVDDGWVVIDADSTNGTYVDGERVRVRQLLPGDRVDFGGAILKLLGGSDVERQYHDEMRRFATRDGLTGLYNGHHLIDRLEILLSSAQLPDSPLCMVTFEPREFDQVKRTFGRLIAHTVLRSLADLAWEVAGSDAVLARYGLSEFAWVLRRTEAGAARERAQELADRVGRHRFELAGEGHIPVSLTASVTPWQTGWEPETLLRKADELLHRARRTDSIEVWEETSAAARDRTILPGNWLLRRILASDGPWGLAAFELDDESAVVESLGLAAVERWMADLRLAVGQEARDEDLLGSWQDRYVLVATRRSQPSELEGMLRRVRERWSESAPDDERTGCERRLRAAALQSEEVLAAEEGALHQLVQRLLRRDQIPTEGSDPISRLPYPLAIPHVLFPSRSTSFMRARAVADGIEVTLKFVAAVVLSHLRAHASEEGRQRLVEALRPLDLSRPLTMGAWNQVVQGLTRLVPSGEHGAASAIASVWTRSRGSYSALARRVARAVDVRNRLAHATVMSEDAFGEEERSLTELFGELAIKLQPLGSYRLTSAQGLRAVDADEDGRQLITYECLSHRGPVEPFQPVVETSPTPLALGWCHLVEPDAPPRCLAPVVWAGDCEACSRAEVFLADGLCLGPKGTQIKVRGVTTNHVAEAPLPGGKAERLLFEAWQGPEPS